jgi:hypothetical protein
MADGLEHWGIILVHQRHRYGPGEVARRMASLVRALGREGLRNSLVFLSDYSGGD